MTPWPTDLAQIYTPRHEQLVPWWGGPFFVGLFATVCIGLAFCLYRSIRSFRRRETLRAWSALVAAGVCSFLLLHLLAPLILH